MRGRLELDDTAAATGAFSVHLVGEPPSDLRHELGRTLEIGSVGALPAGSESRSDPPICQLCESIDALLEGPADDVLALGRRIVDRAETALYASVFSAQGSQREKEQARTLATWVIPIAEDLVDIAASPVPSAEDADRLASTQLQRRIDRLLTLVTVDPPSPLALQSVPSLTGNLLVEKFREEKRIRRQMFFVWQNRGSIKGERDEANEGARSIELHPFRNRWAIFEEISASIALTTFMTAASFVFLGLVLSNPEGGSELNEADPTAFLSALTAASGTGITGAGGFVSDIVTYVDVIFLFVASFGFFFATLSYANASGELARHSTLGHEAALERGNRISEYFGVYPLIFAIPFTVERYLTGEVAAVVAVLAALYLTGYHAASGFSLIERDIGDESVGTTAHRRVLTFALVGLMGIGWAAALFDLDGLLLAASVGLLLFLGGLFVLAGLFPERPSLSRYRVHAQDLMGEETPSAYELAPMRGDGLSGRREGISDRPVDHA